MNVTFRWQRKVFSKPLWPTGVGTIHRRAFDECIFGNFFILDVYVVPPLCTRSIRTFFKPHTFFNTRIRVDGALIGFEKDAVSVIHWFRVDRRLIREKKICGFKNIWICRGRGLKLLKKKLLRHIKLRWYPLASKTTIALPRLKSSIKSGAECLQTYSFFCSYWFSVSKDGI